MFVVCRDIGRRLHHLPGDDPEWDNDAEARRL